MLGVSAISQYSIATSLASFNQADGWRRTVLCHRWKPSKNAAVDPLLIAKAEMQGCTAAPPCVVLARLVGNGTKGR